MVLCYPDVRVVGHADSVDGGNNAVARAEIAFDLQVALRVALQAGEDGLIGRSGDGAQ